MKIFSWVLFIAVAMTAFIRHDAGAETAAVVSSFIKNETISRVDARAIYLMKARRWDNGQQIVLFQMPHNSRAHKQFVRDVLEMSAEQYAREWDRLTNAGLSTSIKIVNSEREMLQRIAGTSSGLGYIDADHLVIHDENSGVRTLRIVD